MSKSDDPEIVKREVGEKVKIHFDVEADSTKDLGDGILEAVVTTSELDRHGENIITTGISTENYIEKNPVVLYGHDYFGLPIGKTIKLTEMKNKMKAKFQLAIEEFDFAKTVYELVKGGYLNAVSIGGIVKKWSEDYRTIEEMEMVEFSIVSIPANPSAMITSRSFLETTGKSLETVEKEFGEFAKATMLDKVASMGDDEVSEAVRVLKNLTARLEESAKANPSADETNTKVVKHVVLRDAQAVVTQSQRVIKAVRFKLGE